ncbi:MAG: PAS domain-containing protein, partial [Tatlockia sp.]|nr:PAS domain-containing protein [Tatlockia sp.]
MKPKQGGIWHEIQSPIILEAIFENLPVAMYIKNIEGAFLYYNTALADEAGIDANYKNNIITDHNMPWKHQAEAIIKQEQTAIELNQEIQTTLGDYCLKRKVLRDHNQCPIYIVGSYSPQLKIESIFNLDEIIAALPGHVFWKNTDCILQGCNNQQAIDSGLASRDQIIGKTAYDLLFQDQPEKEKRKQAAITDEIDISIMKSNKAQAVEEFVVLPNGDLQYFWSLKKPLHDKLGKVNGLLGVSLDITDRKNLEEALKIAKEKSEAANYIMTEFIANMGHDLATPISDVGSIAQMLSYYIDDYPEFKELFETLV